VRVVAGRRRQPARAIEQRVTIPKVELSFLPFDRLRSIFSEFNGSSRQTITTTTTTTSTTTIVTRSDTGM
jgi:hypothetical protein